MGAMEPLRIIQRKFFSAAVHNSSFFMRGLQQETTIPSFLRNPCRNHQRIFPHKNAIFY